MAKVIMIQGTMSNAGKSLICAALCRIFARDGYRVAPFKSQNMALNSYVTDENLEMGRAQVVQAIAAGRKPSADMNPILLKPTSDVGSQVIVNGRPIGNMGAADYFAYKKKLIPDILAAYERLASDSDIIVVEGAGSPAEINLKQDDIVNMGLAKLIDAPVLLVGDIDRGGVFAQLYGTVALLDGEERQRIKGTIINKFRGDANILKNGLDMLEDLTKVPCLGVVPYVRVDIEDEDSLGERLEMRRKSGGWPGEGQSCDNQFATVDIAVVRLPRMSNYTDFDCLERFDGVCLRYVSRLSELKNPDCIIIPGTKSTGSDLLWMRENGLEAAIKKYAAAGGILLGICGGLQILGESIGESFGENMSQIDGMGLLKIETVMQDEKTLRQVEGSVSGLSGIFECFNGVCYEGYEIHMGRSIFSGCLDERTLNLPKTDKCGEGERTEDKCETTWLSMDAMKELPAFVQDGNILATYVHGVFDRGLDEALVRLLYEKKGLVYDNVHRGDAKTYVQQQLDILADAVKGALDMKYIYQILGLS